VKRVVLALALAGCDLGLGSTPPCAPGHTHTSDGCVLPAVHAAIDGSLSEWQGIPTLSLHGATVQVAVEACEMCTPHVLFHLVPADLNGEYVFDFATTSERPVFELDELAITRTSSQYLKNGYDVVPGAKPYEIAWTDDGFELAIPSAFLPFRGAAIITYDQDSRFIACWATSPKRADPCAAEAR
jgi:hypothetical protein